ncbi:MAG TPA: acyltransferase [Gemmataceae bacterium]|nr:acyltransferase [Gemmataceae bacterium]
MQNHFQNVQALRGVAAVMVVVVHAAALDQSFGLRTPVVREFVWFGFAGVDLFFVLSGFIITATNLRNLGRPAAVPAYLFRRAWRIYPAYWAALGLAVVVIWALHGSGVFRQAPVAWSGWVLLLPTDAKNFFLGQAWTLSYELMFYLAFAALLVAPRRAATPLLAAGGVVVVAAITRPEPASPLGKLVVSPFVLEFLGGVAIAWLTVARGARRGGTAAILAGVAWAAVGVVLAVRASPGVPYEGLMSGMRPRVMVFGPAAVLIVYGFVAAEGRWRVRRWLLRTGDASYSLYLTHSTVLSVGMVVGFLVPHNRTVHTLWLCGTLAAAVAFGFAFHAVVERPLLDLGKRKKPAATEPAPAPRLAA